MTVKAAETTNYKPASVNVKLIVNKATLTLNLKKTISKTYGTKPFSIGAKKTGDGTLSYNSDNKKTAVVNTKGVVTIKGCGKATVTVTLKETSNYKKVTKKVTITVKPKKCTLLKAESKKKGQLYLKWKKDSKAKGYEICYNAGGKKKTVTVKKNGTTSATIKKLRSKATCSVKIRAYTTVNGRKICGDYSKVKKLKIK